MKNGIHFKRDVSGKLREFEIGWKPIAAIFGVLSLPFIFMMKLFAKALIIISFVMRGLFGDPVPFKGNLLS